MGEAFMPRRGGTIRQMWGGGTPIGDLDVGTSVYINVDGVATEFIIVQQGRPSVDYGDNAYSGTANGTWLLAKNIYTSMKMYNSSNDIDEESTDYGYSYTLVRSYLDNTFINLLDSDIKNSIIQTQIPAIRVYCEDKGGGYYRQLYSLKVFILSFPEVGFVTAKGIDSSALEIWMTTGYALTFFKNASDEKRIAYTDSGVANSYWLRNLDTPTHREDFLTVSSNGAYSYQQYMLTSGVRPAFVLPKTMLVERNGKVKAP